MCITKVHFQYLIITFVISNLFATGLKFEELQVLKAHPAAIFSVDFSSDGYIASAAIYDDIKIWERTNDYYSEVKSIKHVHWYDFPICVKFSPDGKILAIGLTNGDINLVNKSDNWGVNSRDDSYVEIYQSISGKGSMIWSIDFSPDGEYLASSNKENTITIWKKINNKYEEFQEMSIGHFGMIRAIDFSSDGNFLATAGEDSRIVIWKLGNDKFEKVQNVDSESEKVISLSFSPYDKHLASGDGSGKLVIWKFQNERVLKYQSLKGHSDQINSISFCPEGNLIYTGSSDGTLIEWELDNDILTKKETLSNHTSVKSHL